MHACKVNGTVGKMLLNYLTLYKRIIEFSKVNEPVSYPKILLRTTIRLFQASRFLRVPMCRFYPSCSEYMLLAITKHGALKGIFLGLIRLTKCHPFHQGGIDEVPEQLNSCFCVLEKYFSVSRQDNFGKSARS